MPECLICKSDYDQFISFGDTPISNCFLSPEQFDKEYFFELKVGFCPTCNMVQLVDQPDREMMFHDDYAFFSSTSTYMARHFKEFADLAVSDYIKSDDPFVVEIGSNDGIMLQNFMKAGIRHLGIEPSANVAEVAREKGIQTVSEFFDEKLAKAIIEKHGQCDVFMGANVMCHIPYLHSVVAGVKTLLKPNGVFMFEDPYLGDIVTKTSYDQIYDEHEFYFSLSSVGYLFEQHDMEVVDVLPQKTHGGSMRYVIGHKGRKEVSGSVIRLRESEKKIGLHKADTYDRLRWSIEASKDKLIKLLNDLKSKGKRVVGYGATSKSATVTNYCGIGPELVEFISDTTPIKQGKYSPGAHIPVSSYDRFAENYPDHALLFAWNHAQEIMAKEKEFIASGGSWIVYVPEVKLLS